jgi:hypothetical protein
MSGGHSHKDDKQGHISRFGRPDQGGGARGVVADGQWAYCSVWGGLSEATAAQNRRVPLHTRGCNKAHTVPLLARGSGGSATKGHPFEELARHVADDPHRFFD